VFIREPPKITHKVYFEIEIERKGFEDFSGGRVVFGLFGEIAPRTVENFRALCTGEKGNSPITGKPLHYKGSTFHRIIPNFMIQGGDITHGTGAGGESIYGPNFSDEENSILHNKKHYLAMANRGKPNTNNSQFFINTVKTSWLDGKDIIFGQVLEGNEVITNVERVGTNSGRPKFRVVIVDSGEMPLEYNNELTDDASEETDAASEEEEY